MSSPQGFDRKEILYRIGTFFLLVGIGLFVFFMLSEAAKRVAFDYFCWSLILVILGLVFHNQARRQAPASGRFGILRRLMPKSKKENQGKKP
jgi:predicted membrane channel-forming protein YqfA (hemolysin III family)